MTQQIEVSAKVPAKDGLPEMSATVAVEFGETAEESIQLFGDEAINSNAIANGKVVIQSGIRRMLKAGKSQDEIQETFNTWKLGTALSPTKVDVMSASLAKFKSATPEQQAEFLEKLKAMAAGI